MPHILKNNKLIKIDEDWCDIVAKKDGRSFRLIREHNQRNDRMEFNFVDEKKAQYKKGFHATRGDAIYSAIKEGFIVYNGENKIV